VACFYGAVFSSPPCIHNMKGQSNLILCCITVYVLIWGKGKSYRVRNSFSVITILLSVMVCPQFSSANFDWGFNSQIPYAMGDWFVLSNSVIWAHRSVTATEHLIPFNMLLLLLPVLCLTDDSFQFIHVRPGPAG